MSSDDELDSQSGSNDRLVDASIDTIIGWVRDQRVEQPKVPLAELLKGKSVPVEFLIDIACIDLMQRRRHDHAAKAEDYLDDFPELANDAARLDLIDAEICVDRELNRSPSLQQYADRFPDLRTQIAELLEMSPLGRADLVSIQASPQENAEPASDEDISPDALSHSDEFSLEEGLMNLTPAVAVSDQQLPNQQGISQTSEATYPIEIPEWFIGEQSIATGPGRWLIRGRDAQHGETLAMKVLELPLQFTSSQADQLLDACEKAAKVQNRSWVVPAVAAIQSRHLAVVRPWVYANPWPYVSTTAEPSARLRQLAAVAYAIQSAHQVEATHGAIQPSNLLIDHDGKVQVIDACSAVACIQRWLNCDESIASLPQRITLDVQDLIRLVVTDSVQWPRDWAEKLVSQMRGIAERHPAGPCGRMGDAMMRWADKQPHSGSSPPNGPSLRTRIANWISRGDPQ